MIKNLASLLLATFFLFSCSNSNKRNDTADDNSIIHSAPQMDAEDIIVELRTIDNSIGLISRYDAKTVTLLNEDGNVWMTYDYSLLPNSYDTDDIIALFPTWKDNFSPWAFKIDYYLVFKCMAENEDGYTVVVDENTLETKTLVKADGWRFQSWDEHLKEGCIISLFKDFNNQLRESPNINSQVVFTDTEFGAYHCKEIQGDWIKIYEFTSDNEEEGWVRWRDGNEILIEFYYSM